MDTLPDIRNKEELAGVRVLVRAGLNVPVENGEVVNDFRIRRALPTISFLREHGAKVIVIAHIGRKPEDSLKPVADYLGKLIPVTFIDSLADADEAVSRMENGDVVVLENVRSDTREKENDEAFAKELAALADVYVNDAFAAAHRAHSSIVGIPEFLDGYAGILFQEEVAQLERAIEPPDNALAILGGAKFETKEPLIAKLAENYGNVFVAGALANDFFEAKGYEIGKSLTADEAPHDIESLLTQENIMLPDDVVVLHEDGTNSVCSPDELSETDTIMDAGPATVERMQSMLSEASFVLWNGPLGNYEKGFSEQTEALAEVIANSSVESIIGGGDTIASVSKLDIEDAFTFVSTGGGAMLQFLLNDGTLPGITALADKR